MPLIVCVEKPIEVLFWVIALNFPELEFVGSIACRFLAPAPATMLKDRALPFHDIDWKDDVLRPSSQVSI